MLNSYATKIGWILGITEIKMQGVIFCENSWNMVNDTRYFPWKFFTNDESGYFPWNMEITIAGTNPNPER